LNAELALLVHAALEVGERVSPSAGCRASSNSYWGSFCESSQPAQKQLIVVAVALTTQWELLHWEGASRRPQSDDQSRKPSEMQKALRNR
jgi:hypothetical protein